MAQIGFTHKTEPVYDRFEKMRRAYEDAHGRTYAPGFLMVLMDAFEKLEECKEKNQQLIAWNGQMQAEVNTLKPVSLQVYPANAEANDPHFLEEHFGTQKLEL